MGNQLLLRISFMNGFTRMWFLLPRKAQRTHTQVDLITDDVFWLNDSSDRSSWQSNAAPAIDPIHSLTCSPFLYGYSLYQHLPLISLGSAVFTNVIPKEKVPRRHLLITRLSRRQGQDAQTLTQPLSPGGLMVFINWNGNLDSGDAC